MDDLLIPAGWNCGWWRWPRAPGCGGSWWSCHHLQAALRRSRSRSGDQTPCCLACPGTTCRLKRTFKTFSDVHSSYLTFLCRYPCSPTEWKLKAHSAFYYFLAKSQLKRQSYTSTTVPPATSRAETNICRPCKHLARSGNCTTPRLDWLLHYLPMRYKVSQLKSERFCH